jgi:hypothetical protein
MRLTLIISVILGADLATSLGTLMLVQELSQRLVSPSWVRKRAAWVLLILCELVSISDRIYNGTPGRWVGLIYSTMFLFAVVGLADSYWLLLKDLSHLYTRLSESGVEPDTVLKNNNGV